MISVISPRPVVGRENDQRIILYSFLADGPQDFSYAPVQLHHHVSVQSQFAFPLKLIRHRQWNVWHGMRQIEEEWFIHIPVDEVNRIIGIIGRQPRLIRVIADNVIPFDQRKVRKLILRMERPHIVRVRQSIIFVETMLERKEFLLISQMPLAEDSRSISLIAKQFRYRLLLFTDAIWRTRIERIGEADTVRITAGHQPRPRSTADRLHGIKVIHRHPIGSHPVDMWSLITDRPTAREISVARIIQIDQNDIRRLLGHSSGRKHSHTGHTQ